MNAVDDLLTFVQSLGAVYREKIDSLLKIFQEVDAQTSRFRQASGLRCEPGCGRCCENPDVETTVLEMLPIAFELWRKNEAAPLLEKLAHPDVPELPGPCVFYRRDPMIPGHGRCSVYALRPLICRLFGFSAVVNKRNQNIFLTCRTIKKLHPRAYDRAYTAVLTDQMPIARMRDYSMKVFAIDPASGDKRMPINQALKMALEKVGMILKFTNLPESLP